jgi:hypothetical protein
VQQQAVWDGVIQKDSMWAFADQGSYKMTLRKTLKNWPKIKERAEALSTIINDKFNEQTLFKGFVDAIYGEEIDVESWLEELESDMVESD